MATPHTVLLYYKYIPLSDPQAIADSQRQLCQSLNLKGRILIAEEGINGTLAGQPEQVLQYIKQTSEIPEFSDIEWKTSQTDSQVFPKLKIKVRDEIVTLGVKKTGVDVSLSNKAHYIEPEQLLQLYENDEDFLILDARNLYEAQVGKFKNALVPPIDNFRDFPQFVETIQDYKDKPIVTYCTGGIRCEKASAYLREHGFNNVRQLHGGIHVYGEKTGGKYFEGEMFVFDDRLHIPINTVDHKPIAKCLYCQTPVTRLIDCEQIHCATLFNCCESCDHEHQSTCSKSCLEQLHQQMNINLS